MTAPQLAIPQDKLSDFCQRYEVRKLALFGSVLRTDFRADSDVDVLIEFDYPVGLLKLAAMQNELSELFGRPVHLSTSGFLSDYFRQQILDTALVQYERT